VIPVADTTALLHGLENYRASLDRHLRELRYEYDTLTSVWNSFSSVYNGIAADQLKEGWVRTASRFDEYVNRTTAIAYMLDERIESLRAADKQEQMQLG